MSECEWSGTFDWPLRKEIRLVKQTGETRYPNLNIGDRVEVKCNGKWHPAEIAERWESRTCKGKKKVH